MPLVDYRCAYCASAIEVLVKSTDDACPEGCPNAACPNFGKQEAMEREPVQKGTAAHFKGEGWARDGYASSKA